LQCAPFETHSKQIEIMVWNYYKRRRALVATNPIEE
jgi:hypothetical protein